jgi:hypothetical protein
MVAVRAVPVLVQPNTQNNPVGWVAEEVALEAEEVVEVYNLAGERMGFCSFRIGKMTRSFVSMGESRQAVYMKLCAKLSENM